MRVDITTYKEDGSELITRRYDFEEHENDVASDAIQDILDDSRKYLKDRYYQKESVINKILNKHKWVFDNDEDLIEKELEEHLSKKEDEAEKIGDDLRNE